MTEMLMPVHPGEILLEEYMKPLGIGQRAMAQALNVSPRRINEIVNGKRSITADTAMRLARYWGNAPEFWIGLQGRYEIKLAMYHQANKVIEAEVQPRVANG